ncbi:hypothetical protein F4780DRAFT_774777 [Xylariomycetidae sp. FL0641]|nr:hypothetical protein F4780DRAFT_774777 [Xylariomycetidae sp. FL0641]
MLDKLSRGSPPHERVNSLEVTNKRAYIRETPRVKPGAVLHIPSRERSIEAHVYDTVEDQLRPVWLNLHGPGFVLPLQGTDHVVLDVATEHPFPAAAVHDVEDAVRKVLVRQHAGGVTFRSVVVVAFYPSADIHDAGSADLV